MTTSRLACLDTDKADTAKILALAFLVVPSIAYAFIADPVRGGWSLIFLGVSYLAALTIFENVPRWFSLSLALSVLLSEYAVIARVPTHKTVFPFIIVEAKNVNHLGIVGLYSSFYIDFGQVFLAVEIARILYRCRRQVRDNNYKPGMNASNNTPDAAVV